MPRSGLGRERLEGRVRRQGATPLLSHEAVQLLVGVLLAAEPLQQVPEDQGDETGAGDAPHHPGGDLLVYGQAEASQPAAW